MARKRDATQNRHAPEANGLLTKGYEVRKLPRPMAEKMPWGHNADLLDKIDPVERALIATAVEKGWSRTVLVHWIESDLFSRQGKAQTNTVKLSNEVMTVSEMIWVVLSELM